jgi:type I restriction enzyme, S subunit
MKINQGWKEVELREVGGCLSGFAFKSKLFNNQGAGKPLIRIRDLLRGKSKTFYSGEYSPDYIIQKGDFLIGMDGEFKIFKWGSEDSLLNQRVCKLTLDKERVLPEYIFYGLNKELKKIEDRTPFVTVKHISLKKILSIKMPLPPINVQKKIVAVLEKAEKLKNKRIMANNASDEYLKSIFYKMFGFPRGKKIKWEITELEKVSNKITDGEHITPKLETSGIPYLSAKNIKGKIDLKKGAKFVSEETYKKLISRCCPEKEDILITCVGTIGRVKRVDIEDKFVFARSVALIKPIKGGINSFYLEFLLSLPEMKKYMTGETNTATIKGLYLKQIKSLKIPLPPIELQEKFASIVKEVEKLKEKQKKSEEDINELFDSLMQKAFTGELI